MPEDDKASAPQLHGFLRPGLADAHQPDVLGPWLPSDATTALLHACLEACRDIAYLDTALNSRAPSDRRSLALLATPALSLDEGVASLNRAVPHEARATFLASDRTLARDLGRQLKRAANGPLRKLRNTRVAHHDATQVLPTPSVPPPSSDLIVAPLGHALALLVLLLNPEGVFAWHRRDDAQPESVVQLLHFYPFAATIEKRPDGGHALANLTLAADPRHDALSIVRSAIAIYNRLADDAVPRLPQLTLREPDLTAG